MSSWSLPCGYESMSWTRCEDLEDHKQSFMNHQRDFDDHRSQLKSQQVGTEADLDPLDLRWCGVQSTLVFFLVGKTYEHIWQCVKTLYPCSSHQNSWDLWMFIPLKMVLIGIDPYPYTNLIGESFFIISHVAHRCSQIISTFFLRTVLRRHAEGYGGTSCHPGTAAGFLGTNHRRMMWGVWLGNALSACVYGLYIHAYTCL